MSVAEIKPRPDQYLSLGSIRIDGGTQPRVSIDEEVVSEYAEALTADVSFPPIIVFFDGTEHWLADGFHRYHAARKAGLTNLLSEVRTGTRRDAVLYSVGANTAHGMRRTNADKWRSVETLLKDEEWRSWTDVFVAEKCGVHRDLVAKVRRSLQPPEPINMPSDDMIRNQRRYIKNGKEQTMDTSNLARSSSARGIQASVREELKKDPHAASVTIAERVGCNPGTVTHVRSEMGLPAARILSRRGVEERRKRFAQAMISLDGYVDGLNSLGIADFADDPRAEQWAGQLSKLIGSLRSVRQLLINGKETA